MKTLLFVLLALIPLGVGAQVNHVGVTFSHTTSEGAAGGNGTLNGLSLQGAYTIPVFQDLKVLGEIKISQDYKGYLKETGTASRSKLVARYFIPKGQGFFVDLGGSISHVRFANTAPNIINGYGKTLKTGIIGLGNEFTYSDKVLMDINGVPQSFPVFVLTLGYQLYLPAKLTATDSNGQHPVIDGKSHTHKFNANASYEIAHTKWLILGNLSYNKSAYTRDCGLYGQALCGEVHRTGVWEAQLGVGYRF